MSDASLQQLSRDILSNGQQNPVSSCCQGDPLSGPDKVSKNHFMPEFAKLHQGPNVTPQSTPSPTSSWSEYGVPTMTCPTRVVR